MAKTGSEAYDLSLFESKRPAKITPLHEAQPVAGETKHNKVQRFLNACAKLLVSGLVLAVIAVIITSQIRLTEMNSSISRAQTELNNAVGETKRLESELASQTSAESVESYADSVGLRQMESGQIEYFSVDEPDENPAQTEKTPFLTRILNALKAWAAA